MFRERGAKRTMKLSHLLQRLELLLSNFQ